MNNESMQLYDIYGTWHTPWWQTTIFFISVLIIFSLFLCYLLWISLKKWRDKRRQLTPWDRALFATDSLTKKSDYLEPKEFYSQLTAILRSYIAERYTCEIEGITDEELLIFLKTTEFPAPLLTTISKIFERAVASKFSARSLIPKSVLRDDILVSRGIVEQTIPMQNKQA